MRKEQELKVKVLGLRGSFYQIGFKQGRQLTKAMPQTFQNKEASNNTQIILEKNSSQILEELNGVAEGLKLPLSTAIGAFSGYDVTFPEMGCSTLVKDSYYVRNYDFSPELYDARLVLIQPNEGFASIGFSQHIIGRLDGMNEKGLVIGLHFVNQAYKQQGFLATTIVRMVLDQCATASEAIQLIKKVPHGYCYNYSITDKQGNSVIVEATPQQQEIIHTQPLSCTNHFETKTLLRKNKKQLQGSVKRKNYLQALMKEELTPEEAFYRFNHHDSPLFFQNYKEYFGTLHTVLYSPQDLRVMIGIGSESNPLAFSFKDWLNGSLSLPNEISGTIVHSKISIFIHASLW
ncbi:linear amide C-N hydrolase [Bacillus sp. APMAM]|nr:linear amide C-N hydrolase [Bacillus sp. APMAM]RTZ57124.1 linear amide C-N hydrolase [Bacillus sp. SAJ1]